MNAAWRIWVKIWLLGGLVAGCNTLTPGFAATLLPTMSSQSASCHHPDQQDSGSSSTICKSSCLAIAPRVGEVIAMAPLEAPLHHAPLRTLIARTAAPDTPPPRS